MRSLAWAALLRHLPKATHDQLTLVTTGGREIAIQTILRIDNEFLALKGRVAATQDAGRLFLIPYGQIEYLGSQQAVKETEFNEWFGSLVMPTSAHAQTPSTEPAAAPAREATASAAAPEVPVGGSNASSPVIKSTVLERFRSRGLDSGERPRVNLPRSSKGASS
jgi:hypothetical protein